MTASSRIPARSSVRARVETGSGDGLGFASFQREGQHIVNPSQLCWVTRRSDLPGGRLGAPGDLGLEQLPGDVPQRLDVLLHLLAERLDRGRGKRGLFERGELDIVTDAR